MEQLFVDMVTPEQFGYYIYMLLEAVQSAGVQQAYVDFGCQLKATWARCVKARPDLAPVLQQLQIMVPWMHGSSHVMACQVRCFLFALRVLFLAPMCPMHCTAWV
jgi:hypothetical protein